MTNTTKTFRPGQLLQLCLEQITVFPDNHDQMSWLFLRTRSDSLCGTTGCLAGHAVLLGRDDTVLRLDGDFLQRFRQDALTTVEIRGETGEGSIFGISELARELLGLDDDEAEYLFAEHRTVEEMWEYAEGLFPDEVAFPNAARRAEVLAAGPLLVSALTEASWTDRFTGASGRVGRDFS